MDVILKELYLSVDENGFPKREEETLSISESINPSI